MYAVLLSLILFVYACVLYVCLFDCVCMCVCVYVFVCWLIGLHADYDLVISMNDIERLKLKLLIDY